MQTSLGWLLNRTAYGWRNVVDQYMKTLGLTQSGWMAMLHLNRSGEGCSQKELAHEIGIEQPTLQRTMNALVEAGYIRREKCPHDARRKTLWFTAPGSQLLAKMETQASAAREAMLAGLNEQEREQLHALLSRVLDNAHLKQAGKR
ncbi:MarR family winged helix-turn-helix transcriptional regulator [Salinimonas sediminis]|uniref:MarR family transcriptional regulator n=1 Tax=Salinimonas sediminis TaxID=2303538 RepID=A0A346NHV5_9ALTE|nr:MarR family transcriptional regulator [Salinimonas sediminis]AXR05112.1 MarR family transcriptional regulator [Salinimonas sediminis]